MLGDAKINIEAIQAWTCDAMAKVQFLADDPEGAVQALDAAGFTCTMRQVVVVNVLNEPGSLGDVALVMAHAGINIDSVYATINGNIVLGVDDVDGAIQVAAGMAVMTFR